MRIKELISIFLQTLAITGVVVCGVIPFSCKVTQEGIEIIGGDYNSPYLNDIRINDNKTLVLEFSEPVKMKSVVVSPRITGISDSDIHSESENLSPSIAAAVGEYGILDTEIEYNQDNTSIIINLLNPTEIGKEYEIFGVVEDSIGNTLTFTAPFTGYNSEVPRLIITEIQIKYGKGSLNGETIYRGEYIEFMALEDGNLVGLELVSASDGEKKKYVFPNVDVQKGQVFLVHLRTAGEGCIDERENYDEATAPHSKTGVLDLWDENTSARLNDSSDVLILYNRVDGTIMDGVMYCAAEDIDWKKDLANYAIELSQIGIYPSWEITNASKSKGCTTLRSLTRQNSKDIFEMVMNNEDLEFPLPVDEDTWQVESVSPGVL